MTAAINTHNLRIEFGKHKGELWTRVPVSYLKWLTNTPPMRKGDTTARDIAKAELDRRGTHTPTLDVSGHAIDRASLNCRKIWHETARRPGTWRSTRRTACWARICAQKRAHSRSSRKRRV